MTVDDVYLVGLADDGVGPEPGPGLPPQLDDSGVVLGQVYLQKVRIQVMCTILCTRECEPANLTRTSIPGIAPHYFSTPVLPYSQVSQ